MSNRKRSKGGRPRKAGDRFPSGKLKPPGPNQILVDRRKALCADPTKASCPLDAAFANGWLSLTDYRTGVGFAKLHRLANPIGPSPSVVQDRAEVAASLEEVRDTSFACMPDEEIAALWDAVFDAGPMLSPASRETKAADLRGKWKLAVSAMEREEFSEVDLVCVRESWPQWLIQRGSGRMDTGWERKRELLIRGLQAIRRALNPLPILAPEIVPMPEPRGERVSEHTVYVDQEGRTLFEAVRISRAATK